MIHLEHQSSSCANGAGGARRRTSAIPMSPMFGERALKTHLFGSGHIPSDVWLVEQAVCKIAWDHRNALILRYQRRLAFGLIARIWAARPAPHGHG